MGNAALRDTVSITEHNTAILDGSTVAVDAPNWLYRYLTITVKFTDEERYTTTTGEPLPNVPATLTGLRKFYRHNITPVFVFDGTPHRLKRAEIEARKATRETAEQQRDQATTDAEKKRYQARAQRLTPTRISSTQRLLDELNIQYLTAERAAEAQAAQMCAQRDDIDYVLSEDYDAALFGAPFTVREFTSSSNRIEVLRLPDTLLNHGLSQTQLVQLAILCGTDYNAGVDGVGPKTALDIVSAADSREAIQTACDASIPDFAEIQQLFTDPPCVTTDIQPRTRKPDVEAVRAYVAELGFNADLVEADLNVIEAEHGQTGLEQYD